MMQRPWLRPGARRLQIVIAVAWLGVQCALAQPATAGQPAEQPDRKAAEEQTEFGIEVAERGLWREAIFRWKRAIALDPTYAPAYNNLAIGYEQSGDFESARDAYRRALELDPDNGFIQQNYDLFREIDDRRERGR